MSTWECRLLTMTSTRLSLALSPNPPKGSSRADRTGDERREQAEVRVWTGWIWLDARWGSHRKGIIDGPQEERWARSSCRLQPETIRNRPGANKPGGWVVQRMGQAPPAPSGRKRQGAQSSQCAAELGFPGPAPGQMQSEAAGLAGEPSGQGEEPPPQGLGGYYLLTETDARRPACQVVSHHLDGQPGGVGGEAARGEMVQPHAVLQVSDGVFDLGVAAMVGLQIQGVPVPVGDEAVIARRRRGPVGTRARASPAGR